MSCKILLVTPFELNNTAFTGAYQITGDNDPLYKAKSPPFLQIFIILLHIEVLTFETCILTLTVSSGCPTYVETAPDIKPAEKSLKALKNEF